MLTRRQKGVSLIEVIIGIAILALLMGLGVPQYAIFLSNSRLKATTDTLLSGLSRARTEAVTRNTLVEMILTDEEPIEILVNAAVPSTSGTNWIVRARNLAAGGYTFIEGKYGAEGSGKDSGTTVQVASADSGIYDGTVIFNGFGGVGSHNIVGSSQGITYQITNPAGGACVAAGGPMRCLNITVSPGGQIRACDPAVNPVTNPTDTRAC